MLFGPTEEGCSVWGPAFSTAAAVLETDNDHVQEGSGERGSCFWAKCSSGFLCSSNDDAATGRYIEDADIRGNTSPRYMLAEHADDGRTEGIVS